MKKDLEDARVKLETDGAWHSAIVAHHEQLDAAQRVAAAEAGCPRCSGIEGRRHSEDCPTGTPIFKRFMYEAQKAAVEVPRLTELFRQERLRLLPTMSAGCSLSTPEPVHDNHLTCCLGIACRACPELLALEATKAPPEEVDRVKAWTCVAHIIERGGDVANEGYLLTTEDRLYWSGVYESLADTHCTEVGDEP